MTGWQGRTVLGAIVLAESAWVFSLLGAAGVLVGSDGSPISWPGVATLIGLAILAGALAPRVAPEAANTARMLVGAAVVYLILAVELSPEAFEADLLWLYRIAVDADAVEGLAVKALVSALIATALWGRGTALSAAEFPTESLSFSFRLGLVALSIATIVDIANSAELDTFPMVFLFFAAGLGGLSAGHLMPETEESSAAGTWPRVIGGLVGAVVTIGLIFSVLRKGALTYITEFSLVSLDAVLRGLFWAVVIPIAFAYEMAVNVVVWLFSLLPGGDSPPPEQEDTRPLFDRIFDREPETSEAEPEQGAGLLDLLLNVLELVLIVLLAALLLYLLGRGIQQMFRRPRSNVRGARDSVKEDASALADVAGLVLDLVPDWFSSRERERGYVLPDGPEGVVDALGIYYEILTRAEEGGFERPAYQTPNEYRRTLESLFPKNLVRMSTDAFNRACYGSHAATPVQISEMRSMLKEAPSPEPAS